MNKIHTLILVEGKGEHTVVKSLINKFIENQDCFVLGFNIYKLYKIFEQASEGEEFDTVSLLKEINEKHKHSNNKSNATIISQLNKNEIVKIYLILDLDMHADIGKKVTHSEKFNQVDEMLKVFSQVDDKGLLLVNYPCFESYTHIEEDIVTFYNSKFNPSRRDYKKYRHDDMQFKKLQHDKHGYLDHNKLKSPELMPYVFDFHLKKLKYICNLDDIDKITQQILLKTQDNLYTKEDLIFIISSIPMLFIDYYGVGNFMERLYYE